MKRRRLRTSRDRVDEEIAAWRDATNETAPWHLWHHAVETAAIRKGAPPDVVRKNERVRSAMSRAYNHGEPVWMAADEVAFLAKEAARMKRHRTPGEELRAARALWYTHGPGKARDRARTRRDPEQLRPGQRVYVAYPDSIEEARVVERGTGGRNVRDYLRRADPYVVRTREGTFVAPRRSLHASEFAAVEHSARLAKED